MPAAWVYLLRCADGSLYCGWTTDLERRLLAHAEGRASRYTRSRRPVALAAALAMPDRGAARREEARIKRLPRTAKLALVAAEPAAPRAGRARAALARPR
jgi:predicted GIY-YIG superfamily endonuclease